MVFLFQKSMNANSEFLSCCGENNIIKCYRNNKTNFNLIKEFSINLIGDISSVIITNIQIMQLYHI